MTSTGAAGDNEWTFGASTSRFKHPTYTTTFFQFAITGSASEEAENRRKMSQSGGLKAAGKMAERRKTNGTEPTHAAETAASRSYLRVRDAPSSQTPLTFRRPESLIMAEFQDLTRRLLAAGGAMDPEGKSMYLLYADHSSLVSKHWTGTSFGDQDVVATSVRTNSTASYLLAQNTRRIICISSSSALRALTYNDDDEEWVDDTIPRHDVHPEGKLATSFDADNRVYVFFQDPAGRLIQVDDAWNPTVLLAEPVAGSPIATAFVEDKIHVFYISAKDNCIHYVIQGGGSGWSDELMSKCSFEEEKVKRFSVGQNEESGALEAYVLTEKSALLQIVGKQDEKVEAGEEKTVLGKVDETGTFVAGTSAECCPRLWGPRRRRAVPYPVPYPVPVPFGGPWCSW
ncbi:hypothetical protein EW146_g9675 [Bondarzewia mesenterica]|uniref:Fucose-specific lectin n=1 Tax=Bondarzewia mesenterica TaxID=1095465 RepID=A0A4S4L4A4_9AGAM|nr:hypothetical protein EW146_g9675 [Bondarzewia mesenterica]